MIPTLGPPCLLSDRCGFVDSGSEIVEGTLRNDGCYCCFFARGSNHNAIMEVGLNNYLWHGFWGLIP